MRCPYCGQDDDKVIDSRATDGGKAIRRRRVCLKCDKRFTTYEHIEERARLMVIKKDGTRVPYDREKIVNGLEKACYKRPVSSEQMQKLVDEVEEQLFRQHDREVQALDIGQAISERLKRLDQVAYVRFASVYKQFRDLDDLLEEVREVLESGATEGPNQGRLF
jgi:transcriptional repressor NrdR